MSSISSERLYNSLNGLLLPPFSKSSSIELKASQNFLFRIYSSDSEVLDRDDKTINAPARAKSQRSVSVSLSRQEPAHHLVARIATQLNGV